MRGGAGSFSPRQLSSGANTLDYNLYTNSARSLVWGDGNAGTSTVSDGYGFLLLLVEERSYTVFGRVPTAQLVSSGTYTDSLTVTIVF